jgi:hypothetical protein
MMPWKIAMGLGSSLQCAQEEQQQQQNQVGVR